MKPMVNNKKIELINDKKVMSVNLKNYTNKIFDESTIRCLLKSEDDIEKGRTRKATEVIKELEERYGF